MTASLYLVPKLLQLVHVSHTLSITDFKPKPNVSWYYQQEGNETLAFQFISVQFSFAQIYEFGDDEDGQ